MIISKDRYFFLWDIYCQVYKRYVICTLYEMQFESKKIICIIQNHREDLFCLWCRDIIPDLITLRTQVLTCESLKTVSCYARPMSGRYDRRFTSIWIIIRIQRKGPGKGGGVLYVLLALLLVSGGDQAISKWYNGTYFYGEHSDE